MRGRGEDLWHEQRHEIPVYVTEEPYLHRGHRPYYYSLETAAVPEHNEMPGTALVEENKKVHELEVSRSQREAELKAEYDQRIQEMTADYRAKLRDLDVSYSDRKRELDKERQEIQRQVETAQSNLNNRDYGVVPDSIPIPLLDEPMSVNRNHKPFGSRLAATFFVLDFGMVTECVDIERRGDYVTSMRGSELPDLHTHHLIRVD